MYEISFPRGSRNNDQVQVTINALSEGIHAFIGVGEGSEVD
jgi:hypothetical protein